MKVSDPVCGMTIESDEAAATERHEGQTYYFCSVHCRDVFKAEPARYTRQPPGSAHESRGHGPARGH